MPRLRNPTRRASCSSSWHRPSTRRSCKSTAWNRALRHPIDSSSGPLSSAVSARIVSGVHQLAKRSVMRLAQSLFFLVAAALALAVGASYAEDKVGRDKDDPGFNNLDKNKDGYISRSEAKGNPTLYKNYKKAEQNGDVKLARID